MWDFCLSLWSNRNDDLYGADDTARKALQLSKLNARITYEYEVDASDLHIFHQPLASRLVASLSFTDAPISADSVTPILPSLHRFYFPFAARSPGA